MKTKKLNKKLDFRKTTVATLSTKNQQDAKGGYFATDMHDSCYTWHPVCYTRPDIYCTGAYCVPA